MPLATLMENNICVPVLIIMDLNMTTVYQEIIAFVVRDILSIIMR